MKRNFLKLSTTCLFGVLGILIISVLQGCWGDEDEAMIRYINEARTNPAAFARTHLDPASSEPAEVDCFTQMTGMSPLPAYEKAGGLNLAALAHSQDMRRSDDVGHTGSDGTTWESRITDGGGSDAMGVNVGSSRGRDPSLRQVIAWLIDADPYRPGETLWHRNNILSSTYRYIGVAVEQDDRSSSLYYCTAYFAQTYVDPF